MYQNPLYSLFYSVARVPLEIKSSFHPAVVHEGIESTKSRYQTRIHHNALRSVKLYMPTVETNEAQILRRSGI
jgi:hypothetical protein